MKRSFDVLVSGSALLALSPLFMFVALMIKRDGGSAFYSDRRSAWMAACSAALTPVP